MRLRHALGLLFIAALPALGQTADSSRASVVEPPSVALWGTLTLGPGLASNRQGVRIGAQLGAFGSYGPWIAGYRRAGASGIDTGGAYDDALLIGRRWLDVGSTVYTAVGPAKVYDESTGRGYLGIGASAEFGANVGVLGLGISAFAASSLHTAYAGIGLTLDAGWIR
jgi:hypothetical protein